MPIRLSFHGATSTVTGSRYPVEHDGDRFLVVCGLFRGTNKLRQQT
jgi:metallo-beta-lactamase family protein